MCDAINVQGLEGEANFSIGKFLEVFRFPNTLAAKTECWREIFEKPGF